MTLRERCAPWVKTWIKTLRTFLWGGRCDETSRRYHVWHWSEDRSRLECEFCPAVWPEA